MLVLLKIQKSQKKVFFDNYDLEVGRRRGGGGCEIEPEREQVLASVTTMKLNGGRGDIERQRTTSHRLVVVVIVVVVVVVVAATERAVVRLERLDVQQVLAVRRHVVVRVTSQTDDTQPSCRSC